MAKRPKLEDTQNPERCETCRYFKAVPSDKGEPHRGMCRRYPDVVLGVDEDGVTLQVKVIMHADEWCGEFQISPHSLN